MIITKKAIPRRMVLRGLGATVALPLLDSMVPAFTAVGRTAATPVRRLGAIYAPNGFAQSQWTPAAEGAAFEFTPILQPLAPFRNRLLVLSGLANREADAKPGEGVGDHARGGATWLSGVHPKKTEGAAEGGVSMDQVAAKEFGRETQLASLELSWSSTIWWAPATLAIAVPTSAPSPGAVPRCRCRRRMTRARSLNACSGPVRVRTRALGPHASRKTVAFSTR